MGTGVRAAHLLARDVVVGKLDLAHAPCAQRLAERVVSKNPGPAPRLARRAALPATVATVVVPLIAVRARRRGVRLRWHGHRARPLCC